MWIINAPQEPMQIPEMLRHIDDSKKQYGIVLVYGSIVEFAGGSVVQNAEIVASNKAAYKKSMRPS